PPGKRGRLLLAALGRAEHLDGPTDDLVGRIAVEQLGRPVPGRDDPVEGAADDRVVRGPDDGRELRVSLVDGDHHAKPRFSTGRVALTLPTGGPDRAPEAVPHSDEPHAG